MIYVKKLLFYHTDAQLHVCVMEIFAKIKQIGCLKNFQIIEHSLPEKSRKK